MAMSRLVDIVKKAGVLVVPPLLAINWIFGVEPQICRFDRSPITRTSFRDYMASADRAGHDSTVLRSIVAVAYPGARLGAYLHNEFFSEVNEKEK